MEHVEDCIGSARGKGKGNSDPADITRAVDTNHYRDDGRDLLYNRIRCPPETLPEDWYLDIGGYFPAEG